jgi:thiol-disulfide isomerase/thioredoxin
MSRNSLYSVLSARYLVLAWLPVLVPIIAGCNQPTPSSQSEKPSTPTTVTLTRGDAKVLDDLIAKHKGQVILVDYWATWCGPCVENFPHTVALSRKYRDQGLSAIAVSFDLLDDEQKVRDFLAQKGADFENLISSHDSIGQKTFADFSVGPLPEYRLYDRQGKLGQKWEAGLDPADLVKQIETKIQELLAEKP